MHERTAGIDLASEEHRLVVVDGDGQKVDERRIMHGEQGLLFMLRRLLELRVERVALEQPNGVVVERLLDAGVAVVRVSDFLCKRVRVVGLRSGS